MPFRLFQNLSHLILIILTAGCVSDFSRPRPVVSGDTGTERLSEKSPPQIEVVGTYAVENQSGPTSDRVFPGHKKRITSLSFHPDGTMLASASNDGSIRIWNVPEKTSSRKMPLVIGAADRDGVRSTVFSPKGDLLASGGWNGFIRLWDPRTGHPIKRIRAHRGGVSAVAFTPDGSRLVSAGNDHTIRLWDVASGKRIFVVGEHTMAVSTIAVTPDGKRAVSGGADKTVRVWDLEDGQEVGRFDGHSGLITSVAITPDQLNVVSAGMDSQIFMWSLDSGELVRTFGNDLGVVSALSVSPDGSFVIGADGNAIRMWNTETGEETGSFNPHRTRVTSITFSPSGHEIASAGNNGLVKYWKPEIRQSVENLGRIEFTDAMVRISGTVSDDSRIARFALGDDPLPLSEDGEFSVTRNVLMGENRLVLTAIDEWGNKAQYKLQVLRTKQTKTHPPLDPFKIQGRRNSTALALIIGIENYQSMPPALFAENDARLFYDFARNSLGIPAEGIHLLTGEQTRRSDILKGLNNWLSSKVDAENSDVFVFFSGHGLAAQDRDGNISDAYLLASDSDSALLADTAITRSRFLRELKASSPRTVTLFMDTCYSGMSRDGQALVAVRPGFWAEDPLRTVPQEFSVLTAAAQNQVSGTFEQQKHGLFSYFLMRALQGEADTAPFGNSDSALTMAEIHNFVAKHVSEYSVSQGRKQHPQIVGRKNPAIAQWE